MPTNTPTPLPSLTPGGASTGFCNFDATQIPAAYAIDRIDCAYDWHLYTIRADVPGADVMIVMLGVIGLLAIGAAWKWLKRLVA